MINAGFEAFPTTNRKPRNRFSLVPLSISTTAGSIEVGNHDECLRRIEKIFVLSDLHTDHKANLSWLRDRYHDNKKAGINVPGEKDALIIAGDISHQPSLIKKTLKLIREQYKCVIFFIFGNHEAWIHGSEMDGIGLESSLKKLELVSEICQDLDGVYTHVDGGILVGDREQAYLGDETVTHCENSPCWILPLQSWYDGSLAIDGCQDLCTNFEHWPWVDFNRCAWPSQHYYRPNSIGPLLNKTGLFGVNASKIPLGLNNIFLKRNEVSIAQVRQHLAKCHQFEQDQFNANVTRNNTKKGRNVGLVTFSHFLPNQQCLPDWKNVTSVNFDRTNWLDHGAGKTSCKFALVAGSQSLDAQIRSITNEKLSVIDDKKLVFDEQQQHIHVFGHSHRPKDFNLSGVRYVHNPLGSPRERESHMITECPEFQLIWDTRSTEGQIYAKKPLIRYWEEHGGGLDYMRAYFDHRKLERARKLEEVRQTLLEDGIIL